MTETVMPKDIVDALKPEYVAPLVAYLCHESCEESGQCYEVGGGWIAKMRWQRAKGGVLPFNEWTPEGVAKIWDKVIDFENEPDFPETTQDSMGNVFQAIEVYNAAKSKL